MDNLVLIFITLTVVAIVLTVIILNVIQSRKNKQYKKMLDGLEVEKNILEGTPIASELDKIEELKRNEKLEVMYEDWVDRLETIKNVQIPKLTDMLIAADYSLSKMDYKSTMYKIAKLEMELYKVRTNSEFLLGEIKEITDSEERSRAIITKLKANYRELYQKFNEMKNECGEIAECIELQFENIAKRFEIFEKVMDNNDYVEVPTVVKSIEEMLKHMDVVVDEVPAVVMLTKKILPKKIKDVEDTYRTMTNCGYPLDYLNVEYNIEEANKKINDIYDRCKVLNLEDSLLELKVLMDYFESLFSDFEKEKVDRANYDDANRILKKKLEKINNLVDDIFSQIHDIRNVYNLSETDINLLNDVRNELKSLNSDYKTLITHTGNATFAYSKLTKEIETLVIRLSDLEDRLDNSLDAIGSMRDDEVRARQQLEEVKLILKDAKLKMRDYNLPVIPKSYFVELKEAQAAIKEIVRELEKKPITISVLNTRVDTARDLVFKLFADTKEIMKTAMFAEMAIVYGNRYRTSIDGLDHNLTYSETLFFKGEYQKSLELTINSLNKIEPGIYDKLLNLYGDKR